jgi:chromosome partitioning protein
MDDDAFCDLAVDWLTTEEKGKDKKRAVGLVWLTILLDDTPTKIDAYVAEPAARTTFSEIGILSMRARLPQGRKVLMLDLDRQASLREWYADREAEEPEVDTVELPKLEEALGGLEKLGFDYVFIDTPGKDDPANSKAITLSDFCIIPCRPTPGDMKAIRPTIANVDRVGKPTAFVLTQTPPKSFRVTEAKTALSMLGLVATTSIVQRNDHQDAQGAGLGVTEYATRTARPPRR